MLMIYGKGLALGGSLIMAIGAQNAFVLSQGVRKRFYFIIPLICSIIDAILIATGVLGAGAFFSSHESLTWIASIGGATFLIWYGIRSFKASFTAESMNEEQQGPSDLKAAVLFTLAVSLLNPHVYLDTMLLIGSISSGYARDESIYFGLGAITASFIWFFALSFGGKVLSPLFKNPLAWKILDIMIALIMWILAYSLIRSVIMSL